ncbi:4-hydroxy-tetrahydrodipicolinate synthase [Candidatus Portiera aleyrodidarum]|uniref:4-hydroxy-tetrahydrodipicolinate synthase n=1 Tax=Candidatus Portiera aleyrodidarum MED (Bemisia tabaci) TaxID=1163752 RepID=A0AAU8RZ50_9GAMM|nr:4-hydroxy-tetrahydrodipicolinate synthase [Candidatus Portiera aleyrodidarum]AFQ24110.1 dihydrodipicolinate synthase [Candidatus Portiera aleyrodidarum BT-B-HRs]AFS18873.1 Dihydrodipicolinate synthase [Candidatus Portiera aleyrodidarum BT-QVLC]AFT80506.1 Dihydrodipicolinate synthase [Candidatus Portiera aleyrodidarum BT-QVLC]AFT80785.1 Dihydrodipicolinate synthase [Candidatus Portiera aleyrodidarum BT-B-HRs]AJF24086.1 dihydrodipicolinate synthase [Candidatus Portiera aleyrodidarum MED (Bemi
MIRGSIVAIVTPMKKNGVIDWASLRNLVKFHLENKTDAILAAGTTGENTTMTLEEHGKVIRTVVKEVNKKISVIAGIGANSTIEAVKLTKMAKDAGAEYGLSVTPYYNKPTQYGMYNHFKEVATVGLPIIVYNVPKRTGVDINNETILKLSLIKNIVGIKESSGNLARALELIEKYKKQDFYLLSGDDSTACEFILAGGHGVISVTSNIVPKLMHELCIASSKGKIELAYKLNKELMPLHYALSLESNPIPVKWALKKMGLVKKGIRLPLTWLATKYKKPLLKTLKSLEVI